MAYRTRTYIAGDRTGDSDLIGNLQFWNESANWNLSYIDARELTWAASLKRCEIDVGNSPYE